MPVRVSQVTRVSAGRTRDAPGVLAHAWQATHTETFFLAPGRGKRRAEGPAARYWNR